MKKNSQVIIVLWFIFFPVFFVRKAYAYLDPGTGSYVFQIIIASLIGSLFAIKLFWRKIFGFFKNIFLKKEQL